MKFRHLNLRKNISNKTPICIYNKFNFNHDPLRMNQNYLKESNNKKIKEIKKVFKEEEKTDINTFNKTYNNKPMYYKIRKKENSYNLNNRRTTEDFHKINNDKKLPRNISSHSISKGSTLYKTKNRLLNSIRPDNQNNRTVAVSPKRSILYPKKGRALSAATININKLNLKNKNSLKKNSETRINRTLGNGGFITALDPVVGQNQLSFIKTNNNSNNRSYFLRRLKSEKKFLSYFDIQRILFLDRKVYKPDKEFEKKIYELKNNNSDEFIMNFNFDEYKFLILRLFQRQVSSKNYEIMKKNFEIINRGWKQKEGLKKRHNRRLIKSATSATERELKYNQEKLEREKRIREKYAPKTSKVN